MPIYKYGKEEKVYRYGTPLGYGYHNGESHMFYELYRYSYTFHATYDSAALSASGGTKRVVFKVKTYLNEVEAPELEQVALPYDVQLNSSTDLSVWGGVSPTITEIDFGVYDLTLPSKSSIESEVSPVSFAARFYMDGSLETVTFIISQQANSITVDEPINSVMELLITTPYDYSFSAAPASGAIWAVSASGIIRKYSDKIYSSGAVDYDGFEHEPEEIDSSLISIYSQGNDYLTGSGLGNDCQLTWEDRTTNVGSLHTGEVVASYNDFVISKTVYQQANIVESSVYTITSFKLNGVDGNIEVPAIGEVVNLEISCEVLRRFTSGAESLEYALVPNSVFSIQSVEGFSLSGGKITVASHTNLYNRVCAVTATYLTAPPVQRTITQTKFQIFKPTIVIGDSSSSSSSVTLEAIIESNGFGTISACVFKYGVSPDLNIYLGAEPVQSGPFSVTIGPYVPGTKLQYLAYATNEAGTTETDINEIIVPLGHKLVATFGTIMPLPETGVLVPAVKIVNITDSTSVRSLIARFDISWSAKVQSSVYPYTVHLDTSATVSNVMLSGSVYYEFENLIVIKLSDIGSNQFNNPLGVRYIKGSIIQTPFGGSNASFDKVYETIAEKDGAWPSNLI